MALLDVKGLIWDIISNNMRYIECVLELDWDVHEKKLACFEVLWCI